MGTYSKTSNMTQFDWNYEKYLKDNTNNSIKRKTALDWLYSHLFPKQLDGFSDEEWGKIDKAFEQAKQMEKQQIIEAAKINLWCAIGDGSDQAEEYYNETYGK